MATSSDPASSAAGQPPSDQARRVAVARVLSACRSGRIDLNEAEELLSRIYAAPTAGELHAATVGLPHAPAPLVVPNEP